jgi:hypothetical protein
MLGASTRSNVQKAWDWSQHLIKQAKGIAVDTACLQPAQRSIKDYFETMHGVIVALGALRQMLVMNLGAGVSTRNALMF